MGPRRDLRGTGERIEALLAELRSGEDAARAEELVRLLMELYGGGLERVVELVRAEPGGEDRLRRLAADPLIGSLLALHDLHPVPLQERIEDALQKVRPYLGSHAGGVELLGTDEHGVVHLRLEGTCHGCPSSSVTVNLAIEQAIREAAPEVAGISVEGLATAPRPLQIAPLGSSDEDAGGDGAWVAIEGVGTVLPGSVQPAEVEGVALVLIAARGELYAYADRCAACGARLGDASLHDTVLACRRCGARFDVRRAGTSLDGGSHLHPLPLLFEEGGWKVAIPSGRVA